MIASTSSTSCALGLTRPAAFLGLVGDGAAYNSSGGRPGSLRGSAGLSSHSSIAVVSVCFASMMFPAFLDSSSRVPKLS